MELAEVVWSGFSYTLGMFRRLATVQERLQRLPRANNILTSRVGVWTTTAARQMAHTEALGRPKKTRIFFMICGVIRS